MQIRITIRYIIAFFALNMFVGELHEQAHITTGYFICGCYGIRDFSVWTTCADCARPAWSFLATLAGPLFSCSLMWLGAYWFANAKQLPKRMFGFSLLFANLPFARIFTALTGGGDEKVVIRALLKTADPFTSKLLAAIIVTAICLPPIIMVYKKLARPNRLWIILGFCCLPLVYGMLYHHMFLNWLLKKGVASTTPVAGTPLLILLHTLLMLMLLIAFRKGLFQLRKPAPVL